MKILIGAVAVLVLMIGGPVFPSEKQQSAYALTAYQSGFLQGVHDMIHNHFIILKTTKYTNEYVNGYNHGLTAAYPATLTDYQSGFNHGVSDGKDSCLHPDGHCHWYILEPGKGFAFHTKEFVIGYVTGWCSVPGNANGGADSDHASFDCPKGPDSAWWVGK